ncbi:MAG: DUF5337 domain-containing protein [Yoonia sp.]|nr:DUF5337 domain-containing protein [Yoonia sp.]
MAQNQNKFGAGQRAAIVVAATGILWICANLAGEFLGLSVRIRTLFDLIALAAFGFALYMTFNLWRARQHDKDDG